jgi:exosortase
VCPRSEARKLLPVGYPTPQMNETVARITASTSTKDKTSRWLIRLTALVFAILWFDLINQLRPEWWLNPQYNYGLIVPILSLYLLWRRWCNRPAPSQPESASAAVAMILFCAALVLPVRFVAEANPDWRLLSWLLAFAVVTISILFTYLVGGRSWLHHFAFPFLFFLIAVPWPVRFEESVIQGLMRAVTSINVNFLMLAGIPALQHGNVIEVRTGFIGIEEACSGVRSLQAALMISLFLGELYSFTKVRRLVLLIAGVLLAFFCNVVRTAFLVWAGTTKGPKSIEAWHDPAGLTILIACLFGLWVISLIMQRHAPASGAPATFDGGSAATGGHVGLVALLAVWLIGTEAVVYLWYNLHQSGLTKTRWSVQWPAQENGYKQVPITPEAEALLHYNEGGGAAWEADDGHRWMLYFFRWLPGRTAARFVKIHRPDICLPASGRTMERDNGLRTLPINGVNLPVRSYRFTDRGTSLHVFYCYWDARSSYDNAASAAMEDWSARGRLRAAWQGRREIGAQMLELVVWGYDDDAQASEVLERELNRLIRSG